MLLYKGHLLLPLLKHLPPSTPFLVGIPCKCSNKTGTVRAMTTNAETDTTSEHAKSTCPASTALLFIVAKF